MRGGLSVGGLVLYLGASTTLAGSAGPFETSLAEASIGPSDAYPNVRCAGLFKMLISRDLADGERLEVMEKAVRDLLAVAAFRMALEADTPDGRTAAENVDHASSAMGALYLRSHADTADLTIQEPSPPFSILMADIGYCSELAATADEVVQ